MKIHLTVNSDRRPEKKRNQAQYHFLLVPHRIRIPQALKLPPEFYREANLAFPHWEVEILQPEVMRGATGKLNFHFPLVGRNPYVCFPNHLPDITAVMKMLTVWSVGQVCVFELDRYLNEMIQAVGSPEAFTIWAKEQHGIALGECGVKMQEEWW